MCLSVLQNAAFNYLHPCLFPPLIGLCLQVSNPSNSTAVDISGWLLADQSTPDSPVHFVFEPGTVMPPSGKLYVAEDVYGLWSSGKVPEGALVVGPLLKHSDNAAVHLIGNEGQEIDQL